MWRDTTRAVHPQFINKLAYPPLTLLEITEFLVERTMLRRSYALCFTLLFVLFATIASAACTCTINYPCPLNHIYHQLHFTCISTITCSSAVLLKRFHLTYAASLPSFCKCSVGSNYTIISLNHGRAAPNSGTAATPQTGPRTCADCNRQFCIDYNLPFVKGVKEEDISTTCFRESSLADSFFLWGGLLQAM